MNKIEHALRAENLQLKRALLQSQALNLQAADRELKAEEAAFAVAVVDEDAS